MGQRLSGAGYAQAIHALLDAWLRDAHAEPRGRHAKFVEDAKSSFAVLAGETVDDDKEAAADDAHTMLLAAEVLVRAAEDRIIQADEGGDFAEGELVTAADWSHLRDIVDEWADIDEDDDDLEGGV